MKTLLELYRGKGYRSRKTIQNIILSFVARGLSILTTLMIVPLTINYINPTRYGIWLTLTSIVGWMKIFDFGLGNGMRNKFAEAKAKGDITTASQYISTTYFAVSCIVFCLFILMSAINSLLFWPDILSIDAQYATEISTVFQILLLIFCFNMVIMIFLTLLTADQQQGLSSIISVTGDVLSLIAIYVLTQVSVGSLTNLALYYSGTSVLTILLSSIYAFRFTKYRQYAPSWKRVRFSLIREIITLGLNFFIIYLCMLVIFQVINVIISREFGPLAVTKYNIAYKYFGLVYSAIMIIITPLWSAFTDAYHQNDLRWMQVVKVNMERILLCACVVMIMMLCFSDFFYSLWIGESVVIDHTLSVAMAVYMLLLSIGGTYMYLINGIGTIRLQMIIYIVFAIMSWPLMTYSCRLLGLSGIILVPSLLCLFQTIAAKIQLDKLLSKKATGIWNK